MSNPILTIVIPTFNAGKSIGSALESIVSQDFDDYEVIVMDGSSSDNTSDIVQRFAQRNNSIRWISEKDKGVYDAMNKGIKLAKGKWIYFLGADDKLFGKTTLYDIFQHPDIENYEIFFGNVQIVGNPSWAKDGDIYDGEFDLQKLLTRNICHQCIFYRKDFVDKIGYYNTDYKLCADWDYNLRCWSKTKFRYIDKIVAYFVAGGESTKTSEDAPFWTSFLNNLIQYFRLSPFDPLINNVSFPFYYEVLLKQKKANYFKYLLTRMEAKLLSLRK